MRGQFGWQIPSVYYIWLLYLSYTFLMLYSSGKTRRRGVGDCSCENGLCSSLRRTFMNSPSCTESRSSFNLFANADNDRIGKVAGELILGIRLRHADDILCRLIATICPKSKLISQTSCGTLHHLKSQSFIS